MAATQTTNGAACECPVCGEFEGEPESVEAHISGSSDDLHQGEVGRHYRSELELVDGSDGSAGTTSPDTSLDALAEAGETTSESGLDVAPGTMLLGGTVLFAVAVAWMVWTSDDGGSGVEEQPDEQADEPVDTEAGTGGVMT